MSPFFSRLTAQTSARWGACLCRCAPFLLCVAAFLVGCNPSVNHYLLVENSWHASDFQRADAAVRQAEKEYGPKSRVLYGMDRGMTLQLAGDYQQSNLVLEQSEEEVDRLYTRTIRTETAAFLTNETTLPYEGEPYEQVMINVLKALNYAMLGQWQDALVEARRLDHRLNVLSDRVKDKGAYREDGFARYLTGILYESTGDINNAFIAYRKAYETYESTRAWSKTGVPLQLKRDLLRTADALHVAQDLTDYQRTFPDVSWQPLQAQQQLAQVVLISYNGRAPRKEDQFLDLPISLDALQLVLLNRGIAQSNHHQHRAADSVLYGLNGRVVRVALPRLVPQRTQVPVDHLTLISEGDAPVTVRTESVQSVTALADKALSERMAGITVKALARAAFKFSLAEGATRGAQQAAGKDAAPWVGLVVGLLTKALAVASEEADKRSWRTLPDEIHLARVWIPAGQYDIQSPAFTATDLPSRQALSLAPGDTAILVQRVVQ